jgi:glycosyltransferase involved in cell wall biosynthesis
VPFKTSIIAPTFKRMDRLPAFLRAAEAMRGAVIEIIICNRPDDDPETAIWLQAEAPAHPRWRLVTVFEPGVVAALNAGLAIAQGDIIALFDDDTVPAQDWLEVITPHFRRPNVGAVGGRDIVHGANGPITTPRARRAGYRDFWGNIVGGHHLVVGEPRPVEVLKGCNMAFRAAALGTLRFDNRLLGKGAQIANDSWFCLNLRQYHWTIILDPAAIVDHFPGYKPDYAHGAWGREKCFDWTANYVASRLAYAKPTRRLKFMVYSIFVGHRYCPGIYYLIHSMVKRPAALAGQLGGGWAGFLRGWRMSYDFERAPPGRPNPPARPTFGAPS